MRPVDMVVLRCCIWDVLLSPLPTATSQWTADLLNNYHRPKAPQITALVTWSIPRSLGFSLHSAWRLRPDLHLPMSFQTQIILCLFPFLSTLSRALLDSGPMLNRAVCIPPTAHSSGFTLPSQPKSRTALT